MLKRLSILITVLALSTAAQAPGTYTGTWVSGSSGNGGKLNLTFTGAGLVAASFSLQGQEIQAKPISSKADAGAVEFAFEYDVDGNALRSRMQGTSDGKSIKGKYQSAPAGGGASVDEGTWEVTQQ